MVIFEAEKCVYQYGMTKLAQKANFHMETCEWRNL